MNFSMFIKLLLNFLIVPIEHVENIGTEARNCIEKF